MSTNGARRTPWSEVWADPRLGAEIGEERFRLTLDPQTPPDLPDVEVLLAGVACVDITPPPGMPKAGHSKNAHDGDGFRTRLKARVLHLRTGRTSVALIALDLLAGSAVVQHAVARLVGDLDIAVDGIFLAATHTHAGPGQYSGSSFYNDWASNRPGFDPEYAGFLVTRLADAVREAISTRRPARAAIGRTEVWGLTRNRSLGAFVHNEGLADRRTDRQRAYVAIDPRLHLLRVDDEKGPLGSFTWFSIHGTGVSHHDSAYNADVWTYLNGELARRVEGATGRRMVSAAAVASHGDMTPAVVPGMLVYPEAERIGRGLGEAAARLHGSLRRHLTAEFPVAVRLHDVPVADAPAVDGVTLDRPRIGWAKAAGATENTTPFLHRIPPFAPGHGRPPKGPQGEKRIAATPWGHDLFVGRAEEFPVVLPLHLVHLGDTAVLGLPFETTVESGRRIGAAIQESSMGVETAFVSSLVNDQCDYLTTPEEYSQQHYEGASTLFGFRQLTWVAGTARQIADQLAAGTPSVVAPRSFSFGVRRYFPAPTGAMTARRLGPARFVEATPAERCYWEAAWEDVPPGDLCWDQPLVQVQVETADGWVVAQDETGPVDDDGWRMGVVSTGGHGDHHHYLVRWYGPPLGAPGRHRFVLLANHAHPEVVGDPFD